MRRVLCLVALSLALAPPAHAGVLKFDTQQHKVSYEAAPGEANSVTATQEGDAVRIVDAGAAIAVQKNSACTAVSASEAVCPVTAGNVVKLDGGDLGDHLMVGGGLAAQLEGAGGDDVLVGGGAGDKLDGGAGNDTLVGGSGADLYDSGDGDDRVHARDGVVDSLVCGAGADSGEADAADAVAPDCEGLGAPLAMPGLLPTAPDGAAPVADASPAGDDGTLGADDLVPADPAVVAALPAPSAGRTVSAAPGRGSVRIRRPGGRAFTRLDPSRPVPVGSVVDARRGSVTLVAARDLAGSRQQATFTGGLFRVTQRRSRRPTTVLTLRGSLDCAGSNRSSARSAKHKRSRRSRRSRRRRSLWGDGKGRFTTRGRNSQAAVRGTIWGVTDRCDGTLTEVRRGVVAVTAFGTRRTRTVRAGGRYLARNRTKIAR